jgi:hypothetical protein
VTARTVGQRSDDGIDEWARQGADRGADWLLRSGIQDAAGGAHAWYDSTRQRYEYLYPEVTGYLVTLHEWLAELPRTSAMDAAAHRDAARRASRWLAALTSGGDGFVCLVVADEDGSTSSEGAAANPATSAAFRRKTQRRYTFDAGIVLQGLVAHAVRSDDNDILKTSRLLGDWLLDLQQPDGTFVPFTGPDPWQDVPADWSTRPGCHQAKIAIGLQALAQATGENRYRDAARLACEAALVSQQSNGRYLTNHASDGTNVHPHCYAAEACWAIGTATDDEELLESARRGVRWLLDTSPAGRALRVWSPADGVNPNMRIDGLAQTLRLGIITGVASDAELDGLAQTLLGYQAGGDDPHMRGGFAFGHSSRGDDLPHANVWVSSFAVQALALFAARARHGAAGEGSGTGPLLDWKFMV